MSPARRSTVARYGSAVLFTVFALLTRILLEPLLQNNHRFLTFYVAVMAAAWYGGFGPSLLATILGCLAAGFFVLSPQAAFDVHLLHHQVELGGFLFVGLAFATFGKAMRAAQRRAEARARQLADADRRKDEFLAMLTHELRSPLAPIRYAVQALRLRSPKGDSGEAAEIIDRQVGQMARLVDDLLDVSRINRGKITLRKRRIELAEVVEHAIETSRPLIAEHMQELTEALPTEPVWLMADPVRLAQILSNLLNNAAKYTPERGHIWLTARRNGQEVVLRVSDDGMGIAPDMLPHVFDLFAQEDRSLARSRGGLGIGLTLVKNLVEMHGGRVEAHSEGAGKGSEFVVRLPVLPAAETRQSGEVGNGKAGSGTRRSVLVVDDQADAAASLAMLLRLAGHEVHVARDGPAALKAAEEFRPDVVCLDIGLPGMDGYEVARLLRKRPGEVLLVAVTGYGRDEDRRRAQEAGFNAHLVKPADPAALHALLA